MTTGNAGSRSIGRRGGERLPGVGSDAVQALVHALNMVSVNLYASPQCTAGDLYWDRPAGGFGFPVSRVIRDMLVGDDAEYL